MGEQFQSRLQLVVGTLQTENECPVAGTYIQANTHALQGLPHLLLAERVSTDSVQIGIEDGELGSMLDAVLESQGETEDVVEGIGLIVEGGVITDWVCGGIVFKIHQANVGFLHGYLLQLQRQR